MSLRNQNLLERVGKLEARLDQTIGRLNQKTDRLDEKISEIALKIDRIEQKLNKHLWWMLGIMFALLTAVLFKP